MAQCPVCSLSFQTEADLGKHRNTEHKPSDPIPTLAETPNTVAQQQIKDAEAGRDTNYGYGITDPMAESDADKSHKEGTMASDEGLKESRKQNQKATAAQKKEDAEDERKATSTFGKK